MNFSTQPMQNMVPSMKDSFQGNMDPAMMAPPPGGQGGTTEYPKFGMGRHLYSGKIPDMGSDGSMGGPGGMQTMLLPSNADCAGHQQVRPQPASDALLGLHITQLGGLNASQLEGMESAGGSTGPGLGRKLPSGASPNVDGFSMHHLQVDGSNAIGGGAGHPGNLGGGTVVTPSTSYIVFSTAPGSENVNPNPPTFSSARGGGGEVGGGGGVVTGGVAPIGTERAQKATNMSSYPITPAIAPGFMRSVWSYSGGQGTYVLIWHAR